MCGLQCRIKPWLSWATTISTRALKPFGDYSPPISVRRKQKTITLWFPRVEFTGGSAAGYDLDITGWRGSIAMYVEADGVAEETSLEIGFLELFTLPLHACTAESLDRVSADTAAYLALLSQGDVSDQMKRRTLLVTLSIRFRRIAQSHRNS